MTNVRRRRTTFRALHRKRERSCVRQKFSVGRVQKPHTGTSHCEGRDAQGREAGTQWHIRHKKRSSTYWKSSRTGIYLTHRSYQFWKFLGRYEHHSPSEVQPERIFLPRLCIGKRIILTMQCKLRTDMGPCGHQQYINIIVDVEHVPWQFAHPRDGRKIRRHALLALRGLSGDASFAVVQPSILLLLQAIDDMCVT